MISVERLRSFDSGSRTPRNTTGRKERHMIIKIIRNDRGTPIGKLADAELYFTDGPLIGLKLIGFTIWARRSGEGRNVIFPARQVTVNGERHSFALLRPSLDGTIDGIRDLILSAYTDDEGAQA
jgi:sporulation protein YlmC with PRC-barrel domain